MNDTVSVNVKRDLNLRHTSWSWRNTFEVKLTKCFVTRGNFTLTLIDLNRHSRLVVIRRRKHLRETSRYRGVFRNHFGHNTTQGFNTQGQGSDVQQQHVFTIA